MKRHFLSGRHWRRIASPSCVVSLLISAISIIAMNAADASKEPKLARTELATFGGGCFWCVEAAFETFKGVKAVTSGYAGGQASNPSYDQVCTGQTGHAEVVQVEFDPMEISYEQLLEIFWEAHDPTTLHRQGADV